MKNPARMNGVVGFGELQGNVDSKISQSERQSVR
jgi:hypothetical protein